MESENKSYTVTQYMKALKQKVESTPAVWVRGVITQINEKARVVYLSIADFEEGNVNPLATVPLYCYSAKFAAIRAKVENYPQPFTLKEQLKVSFLIKADLYIPYGKLQAQILDIDPVYTLGELALTKSAILKRLALEGLLEKNKSPEEMGIYSEIIPLAEEIKTVRSSQELMRQEFTANVSHELKTPLTSISGYAELIETGMAQGEDCRKFAGNIRTETARLQTLISDILRLSELDSVASASLDDVVDIGAVAKECKERLAGQAENKGVRIMIHGTSKPVRGNHTELSELIYNLIDNAIKYNRENGNIDITIEDNRFIITDTGIGMPKESIPRIFERFYRVDKSRSRAKGGTGLGLSIVKHIADRHGARIDVESTVNVGTRISVNFR